MEKAMGSMHLISVICPGLFTQFDQIWSLYIINNMLVSSKYRQNRANKILTQHGALLPHWSRTPEGAPHLTEAQTDTLPEHLEYRVSITRLWHLRKTMRNLSKHKIFTAQEFPITSCSSTIMKHTVPNAAIAISWVPIPCSLGSKMLPGLILLHRAFTTVVMFSPVTRCVRGVLEVC